MACLRSAYRRRMTIERTYEELLQSAGEEFVNALARRDFERLRAAIDDDVLFRLLLPKGPQAHSGVAETVETFVRWYGDVDELHLESSSVEAVAGRLVFTYRFRLHDEDGWQVIEQHVWLTSHRTGDWRRSISCARVSFRSSDPRTGRAASIRSTRAISGARMAWPESSAAGSERSRSATCSW